MLNHYFNLWICILHSFLSIFKVLTYNYKHPAMCEWFLCITSHNSETLNTVKSCIVLWWRWKFFPLSLRFQIITLLKDLELIPCPVVEREKKGNEQRDSVMETGEVWEVLREGVIWFASPRKVCSTLKICYPLTVTMRGRK